MTLGKKLYGSFGIVLLLVLVLFLVNYRAVNREHDAKKAEKASLDLADATDAVKFERSPSTERPSPMAKSAHGVSAAAMMFR